MKPQLPIIELKDPIPRRKKKTLRAAPKTILAQKKLDIRVSLELLLFMKGIEGKKLNQLHGLTK